mgnify:FL=1
MARRMRAAPLPRRGQCPACLESFQAASVVISTAGGAVLCVGHTNLVMADAIIATGPWSTIRRSA